jgi:hypothetical protein
MRGIPTSSPTRAGRAGGISLPHIFGVRYSAMLKGLLAEVLVGPSRVLASWRGFLAQAPAVRVVKSGQYGGPDDI